MKLKTFFVLSGTVLSLSVFAQEESEADKAAKDFGAPTGKETVEKSMLDAQAKKEAADRERERVQQEKEQKEREAQKAKEPEPSSTPKPQEN